MDVGALLRGFDDQQRKRQKEGVDAIDFVIAINGGWQAICKGEMLFQSSRGHVFKIVCVADLPDFFTVLGGVEAQRVKYAVLIDFADFVALAHDRLQGGQLRAHLVIGHAKAYPFGNLWRSVYIEMKKIPAEHDGGVSRRAHDHGGYGDVYEDVETPKVSRVFFAPTGTSFMVFILHGEPHVFSRLMVLFFSFYLIYPHWVMDVRVRVGHNCKLFALIIVLRFNCCNFFPGLNRTWNGGGSYGITR